MMKRILILLLALAAVQLNAQDAAQYKKIVKDLSSARYQGRGYAKGGANKAGHYLKKAFEKAGADEVITQPFTLDINTFPGLMKLSVDGRKLIPGTDFTLREFSPGVKGTYPLYNIDTLHSFMIGDSDKDIEFGEAIGCRTYKVSADYTFADAVNDIIKFIS